MNGFKAGVGCMILNVCISQNYTIKISDDSKKRTFAHYISLYLPTV